jgi:hypothetical protein
MTPLRDWLSYPEEYERWLLLILSWSVYPVLYQGTATSGSGISDYSIGHVAVVKEHMLLSGKSSKSIYTSGRIAGLHLNLE